MTIEIVGSHLMMSYNYELNHSPLAVSLLGACYMSIKMRKTNGQICNNQEVCKPTERCV